MSGAYSRAQQRLADLIMQAERFRASVTSQPGEQVVASEDLWQFLVSALQAVRSICGEASPHYQELKLRRDMFNPDDPLRLSDCIGILAAAADDLDSGMLSDIREVVAAEVFGDLLDQASHLLDRGYHLPAGATAGAVLEDSLRKLCLRHEVSHHDGAGISVLNTELYKANIYPKPTHGNVDAWGKLRNAIDHHNFTNPDDIDARDVQRMIDGIRDFIVKYLT